MVPLATHRLHFSRKTISTKADLYITHTKDTGRVPVHHSYSLCQEFRLRGRRIEMWAGKTARGVVLGWKRSRSLTSRRTPLSERLEQATITVTYVAMVDSDLKVRGGGGALSSWNEKSLRLGFTGLGFGVKMKNKSEGRSYSLPPANVDRRPLQQRGLINFHLYNKSLKDWSLARQLILFPSNLNVSSGPVIKCLMLHEYVESMWEILLMRKKPKSALLPPQRKI